ncbi:unnamed protein product [Heterobilharzia americana]|nr:unnamed protein product [Heterobilharzia americana]
MRACVRACLYIRNENFGEQIDHCLVCDKAFKDLTKKSYELWKSRYPNEPFNLSLKNLNCSKSRLTNWVSQLSFNPLQLINYNDNFYYQISMPHYMNKTFLQEAYERYQKYLYIRKLDHQINQYYCNNTTIYENPINLFHSTTTTTDNKNISSKNIASTSLAYNQLDNESSLSTTIKQKNIIQDHIEDQSICTDYLPYDIELYWRVHIYHPRTYVYDTSCLFGKTLDYLNNNNCNYYYYQLNKQINSDNKITLNVSTCSMGSINNKNSMLNLAISRIYELWRLQFPENEFMKSGCYYRGISSRNRLYKLEPEDIYRMSTKRTEVSIQRISTTLNQQLNKFYLCINTLPICLQNIQYSSSSSNLLINSLINHQSIIKLIIITGISDELLINLINKQDWFYFSNNSNHNYQLNQLNIKLTSIIENFYGNQPLEINLSKELLLYQENITPVTIQSTKRLHNIPSKNIPYKNSINPRISLTLLINPPVKHSIRLKVQLGPQIVCQLPLPNDNQSSIGFHIWGPISSCPSLKFENILKQHYQSCYKDQGEKLLNSFQSINCEKRSLLLIHKLFNHLNEHVLTARVQHNISLGLSVVHIYSGQRLLCLGQSIGYEQLPIINSKKSTSQPTNYYNDTRAHFKGFTQLFSKKSSIQPSNKNSYNNLHNFTSQLKHTLKNFHQKKNVHHKNDDNHIWCLSQSDNDRAMLVKDCNGDWCLVIGRWSKFKRLPTPVYTIHSNHQENVDSYSGIHGNGGHLSLRFKWFTPTSQPRVLFAEIPDQINSFTLILHDASINMKTGELFISKDCNEIAQNICLAFCCSILHVLCQPRILTHESNINVNTRYNTANHQHNIHESNQSSPRTKNIIQRLVWTTYSCDSEISKNILKNNDWAEQIKKLTLDGIPCVYHHQDIKKNIEIDSINQVKVYGFAVYQFETKQYESPDGSMIRQQNSFENKNIEDINDPLGKSLQNSIFIPIYNKSNTHNCLNIALTFTMCRACGLPTDSLIPSIQYIRYLLRNHTKYIYDEYKSSIILKQLHNNQYNIDILLNSSNIEQQSTLFNEICLQHLSIEYIKEVNKIIRQLDDKNGSNHKNIIDNIQLYKQYKWQLSDFYDYFLLELSDICSGCISGCRYCNNFDNSLIN